MYLYEKVNDGQFFAFACPCSFAEAASPDAPIIEYGYFPDDNPEKLWNFVKPRRYLSSADNGLALRPHCLHDYSLWYAMRIVCLNSNIDHQTEVYLIIRDARTGRIFANFVPDVPGYNDGDEVLHAHCCDTSLAKDLAADIVPRQFFDTTAPQHIKTIELEKKTVLLYLCDTFTNPSDDSEIIAVTREGRFGWCSPEDFIPRQYEQWLSDEIASLPSYPGFHKQLS